LCKSVSSTFGIIFGGFTKGNEKLGRARKVFRDAEVFLLASSH